MTDIEESKSSITNEISDLQMRWNRLSKQLYLLESKRVFEVGNLEDRDHLDQHINSIRGNRLRVEQQLDQVVGGIDHNHGPPHNTTSQPLLSRIHREDLWKTLEEIAIQGVVDGGIAAMGFYMEAGKNATSLDSQNLKNPSTLADMQATIAILDKVDHLLSPIAHGLKSSISYLGEETSLKHYMEKYLNHISNKIEDGERFFSNSRNRIRVIVDAIDGTANFKRGFPLFCSSLAFFIGDQVRVSAIYDPIRHVVYSGSLKGPFDSPEGSVSVHAWHIASGKRESLVQSAEERNRIVELKEEAIGTHFPRKAEDVAKLRTFISPKDGKDSILFKLSTELGSIYALNSGLFASAEIVRGALGGFVNITTNPWDIASGEVLLRACGGAVTDFDGIPLSYDSEKKINVIAAKNRDLHSKLLRLIGNIQGSV
jgi:fructose-1,6-bisphosphatase/inositol monophosphatase family enzyme